MKFARRKTFMEQRKARFPMSRFDMSHSHQGTYDWGYLYPISYEEVSPRDTWEMGQNILAKLMPTEAPLQHEINAFVHSFFVPYRLMSTDGFDWETFITGGPEGEDEQTLPAWQDDATCRTPGSLWDHFSLPLVDLPAGQQPSKFLLQAYVQIWNEYYRDENLQEEIDWTATSNAIMAEMATAGAEKYVMPRAWEKDYFTASLPWQQRGIAPALPISGMLSAIFSTLENDEMGKVTAGGTIAQAAVSATQTSGSTALTALSRATNAGSTASAPFNNKSTGVPTNTTLNQNTIDLADASTFDVSDLRTAFQIQRWMERNARGGARYTEVLENHFDDSPTDDRLQRPEYIGGARFQLTTTEVIQTSESSTTPQGTRTGLGHLNGSQSIGKYHAQEYGIIINIFSIMPRTMYTQGVQRMWIRQTRYDFLWPSFVNLSEQAIAQMELYATAVAEDNSEIFGYQGRYDELRQRQNRAVGLMRESTAGLIHWNLSRKFATAPALNADFIRVETQALKDRVMVVPTEPSFIITFGNIAYVHRALPQVAEPGLIDHN